MVKILLSVLSYLICLSLIAGCRLVETPEATVTAIPLPESITLNGEHPVVRAPISPDMLDNPPLGFTASVTAIDNEARLAYGIAVYLERKLDEDIEPERAEIGRFAAYGPEERSGFVFPAADAFAELQSTLTVDEDPEFSLVFELFSLRATQSLAGLELQLGEFAWIYE